ncbi:MAG: GNVR domain-containing protein, partial [Mariprofundales bacterium]
MQINSMKSSSIGGLEELTTRSSDRTSMSAEIKVIKSRRVLGAVVDKLHLDIVAEPKYYSSFGKSIALYHPKIASIFSGYEKFSSYAWSNESILVDRLDVDETMTGKVMNLIAESDGAYAIYNINGDLLLRGKVGEAASSPLLKIFVTDLNAKLGVNFILRRINRSQAIDKIKGRLKVDEVKRITTILTLKMLSSQPEKSVKIINGIADSYLRQSVEQKSAEKQKTIDFIQAQLPEVKERMTLAENALNDFRLTQGSIDLKSETQSLLERILVIENKLSTLDLKAAEMKLKFTDNHPLMKTLTSQRQRLYQQMQKLSSQVKVLPETEQRILRLAQKVKVNSQLYTFLFNKYQEMKVLKAGTIGNARIIDYAIIPYRANKSNKNKTLLLAILIGLIIGAMLVFARYFMRYNIENPEDIERQFDLALYAVIPHSEQQIKLAKSLDKNNDEPLLLAEKNIDDLAIEGLRSLRTNLHFALMGAKNNIVMITGASEGLGKSFISVNFAHVISQAGKSVLIIDGD